jgi:hypothetical protein
VHMRHSALLMQEGSIHRSQPVEVALAHRA